MVGFFGRSEERRIGEGEGGGEEVWGGVDEGSEEGGEEIIGMLKIE